MFYSNGNNLNFCTLETFYTETRGFTMNLRTVSRTIRHFNAESNFIFFFEIFTTLKKGTKLIKRDRFGFAMSIIRRKLYEQSFELRQMTKQYVQYG